MLKKFLLVPLVLLALLCLVALPTASAQGPVERVEITAIDPARFPVVELRFRAVDAANRHVPAIPRSDIAIQDGETQATAETPREEDGPLTVHFVIETGQSLPDSAWGTALQAVREFANGGGMAEGDAVAVSYVRGRELVPLIGPTTNPADIANLPQSANPSDDTLLAWAFPEITGLLERMSRETPVGAQAVVFIARQLESLEGANALIARAQEVNIPVYTVALAPAAREPLARVSGETGGVFTLRGNGPTDTAVAYDDLSARRRQYAVAYRVSDSQSGTRNVTLSLPGGASDATSYDVAIEPPRVIIRTPDNRTIGRQMQNAGDDPGAAEPTIQPVVAIVGFGQNPERIVRRATLRVDDEVVDSIDTPIRNEGQELTLDLSWDMRGVAVVGDSRHTLVVEVEDELGLTDSASAEVTVRIAEPEAAPGGGGGTIVITATPGPQPTATPIPCISPSPLCERVERPIRQNPVAAISLLVAFLALLLAALMWVNRGKAPIQRMTQTVRRGFDRITNRYRRSEVRAYLELLAGDGDVGHRYELYGDTPIGRSRQNAELLFQQEAENSPISRLHCTITDEEDHFRIRDEDSANGTYLNGERLAPVVPYPLKDGDVIELARVERGGVRLRFVALTAEDTRPPADGGYTFVDGQLSGQPFGRPPEPPAEQTGGRF